MSTWIGNKPSLKKDTDDGEVLKNIVQTDPKANSKPEKHLLVLVLDICPDQKYVQDNPKALFNSAEAFITFGNAHSMLSSDNEIAFLAAQTNESHFLYPGEDELKSKLSTRQVDGQFEGFFEFEDTVRKTLKAVLTIAAEAKSSKTTSSGGGLASALGRALCYINRKQTELADDFSMDSRICVLSGSIDGTSQYMTFMNVFYAALRMGVMIDCCVLAENTTVLSQGADITKGMYFRPPDGHEGLLQHLLWTFLPDKSLRTHLSLPSPCLVDYRAACFCHRRLISVGHVCSMCLSIFCKYGPVCTTCGTPTSA